MIGDQNHHQKSRKLGPVGSLRYIVTLSFISVCLISVRPEQNCSCIFPSCIILLSRLFHLHDIWLFFYVVDIIGWLPIHCLIHHRSPLQILISNVCLAIKNNGILYYLVVISVLIYSYFCFMIPFRTGKLVRGKVHKTIRLVRFVLTKF